MTQTKVEAPFVENNRPFRNLIINGDMSISQRGTSFAAVNDDDYTLDRYKYDISGTDVYQFTISQSTTVPTGQGFAKSMKFDCTTADASLDGDNFAIIATRLEGQNLQSLKKGTSSAESTTLSFWVRSNKTGTYIAELFDTENDRVICKSYTISSSDTWEKKTVTFPGDTTGALTNDNAGRLRIHFWLLTGTNFSSGSLATAWESRNNVDRAVGQVNLGDNTSNEWYITGIQLEVGDAASDFEHLPHDVQLQRCQRYYQQIPHTASASWQAYPIWGVNSNVMVTRLQLPVVMRAAPTGAFVGTRNTDFKAYYNGGYQTLTNEAVADTTDDAVRFDMYSSGAFAANDSGGLYINTTDGRITLSAEL